MTEPVPELVEDLELSTRVFNCIRNTGCTRVEEVVARTPEEWCAVYNFGRLSFYELREELARYGLRLRNDNGQPWQYQGDKTPGPPVRFVGEQAQPEKPVTPARDWVKIGRCYLDVGYSPAQVGPRKIVRGLLAEIDRLQAQVSDE
jgi:hypothetical protein